MSTQDGSALMTVADALDGQRVPLLESLRLICSLMSQGPLRPPIDAVDGNHFCWQFHRRSSAPLLRTFHFCGADTCRIWGNWGTTDETFEEKSCGRLESKNWYDLV